MNEVILSFEKCKYFKFKMHKKVILIYTPLFES